MTKETTGMDQQEREAIERDLRNIDDEIESAERKLAHLRERRDEIAARLDPAER